MKKIIVVACSGGHLNQLLELLKHTDFVDSSSVHCVTTLDKVKKELEVYGKTYTVSECNRKNILGAIKTFCQTIKIIVEIKPDFVISTGAMPGALMCIWGKIFKAKIIWIDSVANPNKLSLSGRIVYNFADLFFCQWESLSKKYKKTTFVGSLL